jgi:hypothetical protein
MHSRKLILASAILASLVHASPAAAAQKRKPAKPAASAAAAGAPSSSTPQNPSPEAPAADPGEPGELLGPAPQPGRLRVLLQPAIRFNRPKELEESYNSSLTFDQNAKFAFGPGVGASLGAEYRVWELLHAGVRLDYLRATNEKIRSGTVTFEDSLTTLVLMATATAEAPLGRATRVGLVAGFGGPMISRYTTTLSTSAGTGSNNGTASYGSNQSATLLGTYLQQELDPGFWVRLNLEWRSLKADSVKAEEDGVNGTKKDDVLKVNSNANAPAIPIDAGGFTLGASLVFAL